jgi:hypothetical protein
MKRAFRRRVVICALSLGMISGLVNQLLAQDAAPPSSPDLAGRIDSLEKQLADLKSELAAQKAAAPAPLPAPAPAEAAVASTTPAAAPVTTGLAGLLGRTTLSGFVDVYYGHNSNQPACGGPASLVTSSTPPTISGTWLPVANGSTTTMGSRPGLRRIWAKSRSRCSACWPARSSAGWNTVTTRLTRMFSHITRLTFAAIRTPSRSA